MDQTILQYYPVKCGTSLPNKYKNNEKSIVAVVRIRGVFLNFYLWERYINFTGNVVYNYSV